MEDEKQENPCGDWNEFFHYFIFACVVLPSIQLLESMLLFLPFNTMLCLSPALSWSKRLSLIYLTGLLGNLCFQILCIIIFNATCYSITLYLSLGSLYEYTSYKSLMIQRQIIYTLRAQVLYFHELVHIMWYIEAAQLCSALQLDQKSSYHSF